MFVEQGNLLKMSFPRSTLPAVVVLSAPSTSRSSPGFCCSCCSSRVDSPAGCCSASPLSLQQAMAIGVGVTLGIVGVFFRDVSPSQSSCRSVLADADRLSAQCSPAVRPWIGLNR